MKLSKVAPPFVIPNRDPKVQNLHWNQMTLYQSIMDFRKREIPFNLFTRGKIEFVKIADSNIKYMNA